jgi:hypothetical protein
MLGPVLKAVAWLASKIGKIGSKKPKKIPRGNKNKDGKKCTKGCNQKNPYKNRTREQNEKSASREKELIKEHEDKLEQYTKDPYSMDNDGRLRNAPSGEIRERIIEGRKKVLRDAISRHQRELQKIEEALKSQ